MSSSSGGGFGVGVGVGVAGGPSLAATQQGQGVAALLVMLAVLCFIFAYCCWGAPFCRSLCRRHCCCRLEDPEPDSRFGNSEQAMVATPTIILLPHGRMLVVDGTIFTQFQADTTGLDLVELGESVIRAQRNPRSVTRHQLQSTQGSIMEMDAETPSKDSLGSMGCFPPPTYESIYGKEEGDMPPSYSDILLHRFANLPYEIDMQDYRHDGKEEIEMQSLENCPHIIPNPINGFDYPYATITSFSHQSFPRQNLSRNPSLISNPLDDYYMDHSFAGYPFGHVDPYRAVSRNEDRRNDDDSTANQFRNDAYPGSRLGRSIDGNGVAENEVMNVRNRTRSLPRESWVVASSETSRDHYEVVNETGTRRVTSNGLSTGPRRGINDQIEDETQDRRARNVEGQSEEVLFYRTNQENQRREGTTEVNDVGSHREPRGSSPCTRIRRHTETTNTEDEDGNFGALADIRESRV